jgi:hypothetical protein
MLLLHLHRAGDVAAVREAFLPDQWRALLLAYSTSFLPLISSLFSSADKPMYRFSDT